MEYYRVLIIAGSDSGGGAGIQADIKSASANGAFAATAITAITAQNTLGVQGIFPLPDDIVRAQIDSVMSDIGANAIKIGMLHSPQIVQTVADALIDHQAQNIVLDPVMVATSGDRLATDQMVETLKQRLIPLAQIITPNLPETEVLLGEKIQTIEQMRSAALALSLDGKISVLVKGGHLSHSDRLCDVLFDSTTGEITEFDFTRFNTKNTHGTGCTLSSAIAAHLAHGRSIIEAVSRAKAYIDGAIQAGAQMQIGNGSGPVNHFFNYWK